MSTPLVRVSGLCVSARNQAGEPRDIVHDVGFSVAKGEVLALIGESGSGKTTIAMSLLGYARPGCRFRAGQVMVGDVDALRLPPARIPAFRGGVVSYVAQSAAASFNPAQRLLAQVVEGVVVQRQMPRHAAEAKAGALFRDLGLPDPDRIGARYPHQVSGGQLQRVMAAMALITDPALVVLDEPTTALDVTTQVEVLLAFRRVVRDRGATAVYVSHDLAVVAQMADRIVVLKDGRVQEAGDTARLLFHPSHAYTRSLLDAVPSAMPRLAPAAPAAVSSATVPVLEARGLEASYGGKGGPPVLRDIGFSLRAGEVLGVIGESGSGKSTLARVLTGLLPASAGSVLLDGRTLPDAAARRTPDQLRRIQIVFQMADTALNPAHTVARILARPLAFYGTVPRAGRARRVAELLDMVRLPADLATRHPADLSGGQKQRVNLARALAANPSLLICDEVTSAWDWRWCSSATTWRRCVPSPTRSS
jgi:peptide/nickel transport system ATP-binding protein